jgi:hypothetical protein
MFYFLKKNFSNVSIVKNDFNGLNVSTTSNQPYLMSIEESNLSHSGFNIYPLKEGKTQFNSKTTNISKNQIIDYFVNSENTECFFQRQDDNKVYLHMINGEFQLNEKLLSKSSNEKTDSGVELKNGDILMIGDLDMFKFFNPQENRDLFSSAFTKKNSLKVLIKNYFLNVKKYEFLDGETNSLNEKLQKYEALIESQRKKIEEMSQQNEINNKEISLLKEMSLLKHEKSPETSVNSLHDIVEKFEQDEKLLNECFQNLKKNQEAQLKSFIFELQNLKYKEQELDMDLKRNKSELENLIELSNNKRTQKLAELNQVRENILKNKPMSDLKMEISKLTREEMDLEVEMKDMQVFLNQDMQVLDNVNREVSKKKFYCENDHQTLEEASEAENETITRARAQLVEIIKQKNQEYAIIENEFEKARLQMFEQFASNNKEFINSNSELQIINEQEIKLREILEKCLYDNDEEKRLVENELADISLNKERVQNIIEKLKQTNSNEINEKMASEYKSLNDLKRLDLEELKQDEERIVLLEENSIQYLLNKIDTHENSLKEKEANLKQLETKNKLQSKKMNELLNEVSIFIKL